MNTAPHPFDGTGRPIKAKPEHFTASGPSPFNHSDLPLLETNGDGTALGFADVNRIEVPSREPIKVRAARPAPFKPGDRVLQRLSDLVDTVEACELRHCSDGRLRWTIDRVGRVGSWFADDCVLAGSDGACLEPLEPGTTSGIGYVELPSLSKIATARETTLDAVVGKKFRGEANPLLQRAMSEDELRFRIGQLEGNVAEWKAEAEKQRQQAKALTDELRTQLQQAWMRQDFRTADRIADLVGDRRPSDHEAADREATP